MYKRQALIRGNALGTAVDERFGLRASVQRSLVCIVTHGEIQVLASRNNWGAARKGALQTMLDNLVTVDIGHPAVIDAYVEFDLLSMKHPQGAIRMGKNDFWIAAATRASGASLLTTDGDCAHLVPTHLRGDVIDPLSP